MEKNTILAVILSTLVLVVFFIMQGVFFPPVQPVQPAQQPQQIEPFVTPIAPDAAAQIFPGELAVEDRPLIEETEDFFGPAEVEHIVVETDSLRVTLTNKGGNITSWKLLHHFEQPDMIFSGYNEPQAFSIAFGGIDAQPVTDLFFVNRISSNVVEFYRDFATAEGNFRLTKLYEFSQSEYMFRLTITLDGLANLEFQRQGFNFSGYAYTLSFGPQIGPEFERLDGRNDFREYRVPGRRVRMGRQGNINANVIEANPPWASIVGRYFTFLAIMQHPGKPGPFPFNVMFTETPEAGLPFASRFNLMRSAVNLPRIVDTFHFYLGPRDERTLSIYHTGINYFGFDRHNNNNFIEIASSRGPLAPLERALKWMLNVLVRIVPSNNFGIAIILLTLIVKILFFPITKKGSEATLRMQALAPKIKELQEKHKGSPQKLQAEMANFYKQEGYNPLSGCLPMLLQIPIFLAMFNLFNNHFDLRGAVFIPGWIPDLSNPEYIWEFPGGARLPLLGWTALRGLPFIYVASQLLYGKVTQNPGQAVNKQMKMMLYVMPLVFFFVLYNMPSGLLIYWIFSNILTLVQQVIINKYVQAKKVREAVEAPATVIVPPKKKRRR